MRSRVSGQTVRGGGVSGVWGSVVGETGSSLGRVVPGLRSDVQGSEDMRTPLQAVRRSEVCFPSLEPILSVRKVMFIFLNYNISQAGNWPWATEWPLGKSSSISLPGKFPSPRLPVPFILGNSKSQRVPQAPGKLKSRWSLSSGVQHPGEA